MILNDITQRRLEKYQTHLLETFAAATCSAHQERLVIESAVIAGIAAAVPDDLLELAPRDVVAMSKRIVAHVRAAQEPLTGE